MQTIKVDTTQNVTISYELANVGERIIANLLDFVFIAIYLFSGAFILNSIGMMDSVITWVFIYLPTFFYQLFFELVMNGQSPGMRIRKIKVIRLDGRQPTIGNYLLRWLLRPVDIWLSSGTISIITIAVSENGQRLGDMAAGTTVVKLQNKTSLSHTIFEETDENYQVIFPQVVKLSAKDLEIIKECLAMHDKTGNLRPVIATAKQLRKHLGIEGKIESLRMLKAIVKDYNHIHGRV